MTTANLTVENMSLGLAYLVKVQSIHHGRKHGGIQADVMLKKELIVLHLDQQTARRDSEPLSLAGALETSKAFFPSDTLPPIRPHPLQQGHISK